MKTAIIIYLLIGFILNRLLSSHHDETSPKIIWSMFFMDLFLWPYLIYMGFKKDKE